MPKVMKICKACGKEYEACHTPNPGIFRWRDVACCIECAEKYIHDVEVARGNIVEEKPKEVEVETDPVVEQPTIYSASCAVADDETEESVETEPEEEPEKPRFSRRKKK